MGLASSRFLLFYPMSPWSAHTQTGPFFRAGHRTVGRSPRQHLTQTARSPLTPKWCLFPECHGAASTGPGKGWRADDREERREHPQKKTQSLQTWASWQQTRQSGDEAPRTAAQSSTPFPGKPWTMSLHIGTVREVRYTVATILAHLCDSVQMRA